MTRLENVLISNDRNRDSLINLMDALSHCSHSFAITLHTLPFLFGNTKTSLDKGTRRVRERERKGDRDREREYSYPPKELLKGGTSKEN